MKVLIPHRHVLGSSWAPVQSRSEMPLSVELIYCLLHSLWKIVLMALKGQAGERAVKLVSYARNKELYSQVCCFSHACPPVSEQPGIRQAPTVACACVPVQVCLSVCACVQS